MLDIVLPKGGDHCICSPHPIFADCWNPLVVGIFESVSKSGIRTSDGTLKAITNPEMPTLQRMHAITADSPRTTMKFHLLQEETELQTPI